MAVSTYRLRCGCLMRVFGVEADVRFCAVHGAAPNLERANIALSGENARLQAQVDDLQRQIGRWPELEYDVLALHAENTMLRDQNTDLSRRLVALLGEQMEGDRV